MTDNIHAPVPSKKGALAQMKIMETPQRPASGGDIRNRIKSPRGGMLAAAARNLRARSETPTLLDERSFNGMDSEKVMSQRLEAYGLDYVTDERLHRENIYDPDSRWYSRKVKPKFIITDYLPYNVESHLDQAKYLCHVIVNLYIAIKSLDIEGLISISSKDLAEFKGSVDDLAMKTDMFRLSGDTVHVEDAGYTTDQLDDDDIQGEFYGESIYSDIDRPGSGKITASSATIININHWTNELKNCLQFDFPVHLRKALATVYYYVSLCQGQNIHRKMFVEMFEALVDTDDQGTDFTVMLKEHGMVLDYKALYDLLWEFLPYPDSDYCRYDLSSKEDLQFFRLLLRLSLSCRPFFDESDDTILENIMKKLLSNLAPSTMSAVLPILSSSVPFHYNDKAKITDYFSLCFSLWGSVSANVAIDTHMYDLTGMVSEDAHVRLLKEDGSWKTDYINFGKFGIFTEDQLNFMFNRLQGHLRSDGQIHSYTRTARPFIHSINGKFADEFFEKLDELTSAIETFVHPSNTGFWTSPIAKFIHSFVKMYHARYSEEKAANFHTEFCLTPYCHVKLTDSLLNIINIGSQNKSSDVSNYYISCLAYLLDLNPKNRHLIFNKIINDLNDALAGEYVNSRHRIISSLKQFTRTVRYMVEDSLYRIHVTNIISNLVSKLDTNDIELTGQIVNALATVFCFVPIKNLVSKDEFMTFESTTLPFLTEHYYHMKLNDTQDFKVDEEVLLNAFRASTTIFETMIKVFVDKLYDFVDVDIEGSLVTKMNQTTIIMQESMDNEMFEKFFKFYSDKFWTNENFKGNEPHHELITIPLTAFVRRDSSLAKSLVPMLVYHIKDQIEKGAGSLRSSTEVQARDVKLVLYLTALNDVLRQTHATTLDLSNDIMDFLDFIYENITNPPIDVLTSIILHNMLFTLIATEVVDTRLFPESSAIPDIKRWGGLQFSDKKYEEENLNIKWHVPTDMEVELALMVIEKYTNLAFTKLDEIINGANKSKGYKDEIEKYLLLLTHCLSGASLLFDPDFNKNKVNESKGFSYGETLLLLKQIRDSNCDSEELDIDLEQIRSDKGDDEYISYIDSDDERNEHSDTIEIRDDDPELILDDQTSEAPSGVSTPVPGFHNDFTSSINAGVAFRELDMFQYNYHYGSSVTDKFRNPGYFKVHKIRSKVGLTLHKVLKFLVKNAENNTYLFQILLHAIKVWFTDVGQETVFNEDPTAFLSLDFIENIQYLAHLDEPYTRTFLAVRADVFHQNRVLLRSTNRKPSKIEVQLLRDVLDLAMSIYPDINKPAQGTMVHCMKQIIGSYSIIMKKLLTEIHAALKASEFKQLAVLLQILRIKKINKKLFSDYKNIETVFINLVKCLDIDEYDVGTLAESILDDLISGLKLPSSICLIDETTGSSIKPPDPHISIQVEAVLSAKSKKRKDYYRIITHLQNSMSKVLGNNQGYSWKRSLLLVRFLTKLQSSMEMVPERDTIKVIFDQLSLNHPKVTHLTIKSLIMIANRILSLSDYNYDTMNAYKTSFLPGYMTKIETSDPTFSQSFSKEMTNFKDSNYFIDAKCFVGWLSWGSSMYVVKTSKYPINLRENEEGILSDFGKYLSVDLLRELCHGFVEDNESKNVFSSSNVSFFVLVLLLISDELCDLKICDICGLCREFYKRDSKASMIMSAEIFGALVSGSKFMTEVEKKDRDVFLDEFLPECLVNDLNHDAFEVWSTITWWLPAVVDIRRCEPFYKHFSNMSNLKDIDSAFYQSSRIYMWRGILMGLEYRMPSICSDFSYLAFDHQYDQVRSAIGKTFSTIIQNVSNPGYESTYLLLNQKDKSTDGLNLQLKRVPKYIDDIIKKIFSDVFSEAAKLDDKMTPQEVLKTRYFYLTSTVIYWMTEMLRGPNKILLIPYLFGYIVPFLALLMKNKEMCFLAGIDPSKIFMRLAFVPVGHRILGDIVDIICSDEYLHTTNQIKLQLTFVEHFESLQLLQLSKEDKKKILDFVVGHLYNSQSIEIRTTAGKVLSGIVHNLADRNQLERLISKFDDQLENHSYKEKKELSRNDINVHGSVLGLSAIVSAFPYAFPLPKWIPAQVSILASWARTSGMAGSTAKETLSNFKKVRADTWQFDREAFTYDELEDLEGVLWKSYYA